MVAACGRRLLCQSSFAAGAPLVSPLRTSVPKAAAANTLSFCPGHVRDAMASATGLAAAWDGSLAPGVTPPGYRPHHNHLAPRTGVRVLAKPAYAAARDSDRRPRSYSTADTAAERDERRSSTRDREDRYRDDDDDRRASERRRSSTDAGPGRQREADWERERPRERDGPRERDWDRRDDRRAPDRWMAPRGEYDRPGRSERSDRSERSERSDRWERPERADRRERQDRFDRPDRWDRSERSDRRDGAERSERREGPRREAGRDEDRGDRSEGRKYGNIGGRASRAGTADSSDSPRGERRSVAGASASSERAPRAAQRAAAVATAATAATAVAAARSSNSVTDAPKAAEAEATASEPQQKQPQQEEARKSRRREELVALPEGVYPTYVPRNPGIEDGEWSERDAAMVQKAQKDAAAEAKPAPVDSKGPVLLGMELQALEVLALKYGQQRYRAKQLEQGLFEGAHDVADITTIPNQWRLQLMADGLRTGRSLIHHSVADEDGTRKFLLQLHDGRIIETVGIPTSGRLTVCVSSQVGCPMRCTFCATGKGGFARNLAAYEIVDQVLTVQEQFKRRVSNVVFMGMGEPLLNLPNVLQAYRTMNQRIGIGGAFITISTVGVPNAILRLASSSVKATLAVSLHAPNQALRERLIPSAKAYPLEALMDDCDKWYGKTGRRITFEYTLLSGVNDEVQHAEELVALIKRHDALSHINLIPWNPVDESDFVRPSRNRVFAFKRVIEAAGLNVSVRETRGLEAAAACGQLRNQFQKKPLPEFDVPR